MVLHRPVECTRVTGNSDIGYRNPVGHNWGHTRFRKGQP